MSINARSTLKWPPRAMPRMRPAAIGRGSRRPRRWPWARWQAKPASRSVSTDFGAGRPARGCRSSPLLDPLRAVSRWHAPAASAVAVDALAIEDVEPAGDDDRRADQRIPRRDVAEDQIAERSASRGSGCTGTARAARPAPCGGRRSGTSGRGRRRHPVSEHQAGDQPVGRQRADQAAAAGSAAAWRAAPGRSACRRGDSVWLRRRVVRL